MRVVNSFGSRTLFFILFLLFPLLAFAEKTTVTKIQVNSFTTPTRIIFNINTPALVHTFLLSNPNRLVVDLLNTTLKTTLPTSLLGKEIKKIRSGHPVPGVLRIVFDLNFPVNYKNFYVKQNGQFILLIYPKLKIITKKNSAHKKQAMHHGIKKIEKPHVVFIVIDPGHGGKDSGAIGVDGIKEKNIVLLIAKQLAKLINQEKNRRVILTRDGDYFVTLRQRLRLAHRYKTDIFISIHADSYFNNIASGASVYALSAHGATSEAARWLARRDNYSELGGVDLGELNDKSVVLRSVLIDMAQTATTQASLRLGKCILDGLTPITSLHYSEVEQAPFVVLKSPDIPSILVEVGFVSNPKEAQHLNDKNVQQTLANALSHGIEKYIHQDKMLQ